MFLVTLYRTFVCPHLKYCAPIWNPHYCKDIDTLEKVQRRATKLVLSVSTLTYESRLNQLQISYIPYNNCRQQRSNLIEAYKIMNNQYLTNADNTLLEYQEVPPEVTHQNCLNQGSTLP